MARRLKVYGTTILRREDMVGGERHHRQVRAVVATTSQKAAAEAMDISLSDFRHNGCETGNDEEIAAAMSEPGRVFWREMNGGKMPLIRWDGQEAAAEKRAERLIRQAEFAAAVTARRAEMDAARERRTENHRAAKMWAERLREEFGLACRANDDGTVEVSVPAERLYGHLSEISGVLRDVGLDPLWLE